MTALGVLKAARKLISNKKHWTKGKAQRENESTGVVSYCALGALNHVGVRATEHARGYAYRALGDVIRTLSRNRLHISGYNDAPRRTHKQILHAFDLAIAQTQQGEKRA